MAYIKRIDSFLVKSFLPPFVLSFLIALFVLVMQTIFIYMDDLMGKGLGLFILVEMIFYLSVKLFPLALAIGVLLASVLVFGNMGEKYELSSLKSAGVSLIRTMQPLILLVTFISILSYLSNDYLSPIANLQFHSRMWDIRKQKPALAIEPGIFNEDFMNTAIWVQEKGVNQRDISNVYIYNQDRNEANIDMIHSRTGEMFITQDGRYFVMTLHDGHMYNEQNRRVNNNNTIAYPFVRVNFKNWHKSYDMSEFDLEMTDQDLFKSHQYMKTSRELILDIDTFNQELAQINPELLEKYPNFFLGADTTKNVNWKDSIVSELENGAAIPNGLPRNIIMDKVKKMASAKEKEGDDEYYIGRYAPPVELVKTKVEPGHLERHFASTEHSRLLYAAQSKTSRVTQEILSREAEQRNLQERKAKFLFELHSKFALAIACLIFLFIGAPMGAIVRKGGFGFPFLISIFFFALFIILSIMMRKMAETLALNAVVAAWLPVVIIFSIGFTLTIRAMRDSKMMNLDTYILAIQQFLGKVFRWG
ncbi:MAG: LptF/LptG family permease [Saprospiraceae bacterium]|nr:LptF/LptG family permease [Saprospiraceae bacterium]